VVPAPDGKSEKVIPPGPKVVPAEDQALEGAILPGRGEVKAQELSLTGIILRDRGADRVSKELLKSGKRILTGFRKNTPIKRRLFKGAGTSLKNLKPNIRN